MELDYDAAAERVMEKIEEYQKKELESQEGYTKEQERVVLKNILEITIKEVVTLATVQALQETKKAVDAAVAVHVERVGKTLKQQLRDLGMVVEE